MCLKRFITEHNLSVHLILIAFSRSHCHQRNLSFDRDLFSSLPLTHLLPSPPLPPPPSPPPPPHLLHLSRLLS